MRSAFLFSHSLVRRLLPVGSVVLLPRREFSTLHLLQPSTIQLCHQQTYRIDPTGAIMHSEEVWKWLDAINEDRLDPLDHWGAPPPRRPRSISVSGADKKETYQEYNGKRNAEVASLLESIPPAGILLRNGSVRLTNQNPEPFAQDMENENHPQSLVPGFPTSSRVLQASGREGNSDAYKPKRLPSFPERARVRGLPLALRSTPVIHVEVKDPVAVNGQGARVVGGHKQNGLQGLPGMGRKPRRDTTAGEGVLHRSNAFRKPSNVRAEPKVHPKH